MKLTKKCKEDFLTWLQVTRNEDINDDGIKYDLYYLFVYMMPEACKNALIIEWLDSVGYKVIIIPTIFVDDWSCDVFAWTNSLFTNLKSRLIAENKAIEHVNELYNIEKSVL